MHSHTVVSGFHQPAVHCTPHAHLLGIGAVRESTGDMLAWTASDLDGYPNAEFFDGTRRSRPTIKATRTRCAICGAEIISLSPADLEQRLPEASTRNPTAQSCS